MSEEYKNAARMLFTNDEENIELVCMQEWNEEEKHLIWLEYLELMQRAELNYRELKQDEIIKWNANFAYTEIKFKNFFVQIGWSTQNPSLFFYSTVAKGFWFNTADGADEQLAKDIIKGFEQQIKQAL